MRNLPLFLFCFSIFLSACHEHAQIDKTTPFSYFQHDGIVNISLTTDWKNLLLQADDPAYQSATLTLKKDGCGEQHFHVEVKPRGVYRKAMCEFPPLKIRFPEEVMKKKELRDHPTLKLVAHCNLDSTYEQLVLKEYLTFKLYNVLTDSSFRTQLARVKYIDRGGTIPEFERYGFLIENDDELAARMNGRILEEEEGAPTQINKPQYKLFTLFQFMVGNTDWALKNRHNVKLIQPLEGEPKLPIPVPYDFDFSGLVDAPYAVPHHSIPVSEVTERFFQWRGSTDEDFTNEVNLFLRKKKELLAVVEECDFLNDICRNECSEYLRSFFQVLESEGENVQTKFVASERD